MAPDDSATATATPPDSCSFRSAIKQAGFRFDETITNMMQQRSSVLVVPQVIDRVVRHLHLDTRFVCHMVNSLFENIADGAIDFMFAPPVVSQKLLIDLDMDHMCATREARATFLHFMLAEIEANSTGYNNLKAFHINIGDKEFNTLLKYTIPQWTRLILQVLQQNQSSLTSFGIITTVPGSSNHKVGQQLFGIDPEAGFEDSSTFTKQFSTTLLKMPNIVTLYLPMPDLKVLKLLYPNSSVEIAAKQKKSQTNAQKAKNCNATILNFLFCSSTHLTTIIQQNPAASPENAGGAGAAAAVPPLENVCLEVRKIRSMLFKRLQRPILTLLPASASSSPDIPFNAIIPLTNAAMPTTLSKNVPHPNPNAGHPLRLECLQKVFIACPNAHMQPVDIMFELDIDAVVLHLTTSKMFNDTSVVPTDSMSKKAMYVCEQVQYQMLRLVQARPLSTIRHARVVLHGESLSNLARICTNIDSILAAFGRAVYETCTKFHVVLADDDLSMAQHVLPLLQCWSAFCSDADNNNNRQSQQNRQQNYCFNKKQRCCLLNIAATSADVKVFYELLKLCTQHAWKKYERKQAMIVANADELLQAAVKLVESGQTIRFGSVVLGLRQALH